ncbi:cyclin-T2-like [Tigriopus californicus]|uniref:cyclin-T2-like n=1 Tax=Tigriopus californicus TaxID=6832 RepID=UPI0027DA9F54|nr:cyclin-T2-like [Tigriopus californicus]
MSAHPASRWYFSAKQLEDTPSAQAGLAKEKELSYRQQAANFIQDMGQRLQVTQLCINTAIVYMQRFYMFHAFNRFHRNTLSAAALFLAAKVEEQPRKLEHVIKVAYICLHREPLSVDSKNDLYLEQTQELVSNENILLQTLGFDVAIDHPHTHVVRCCQLVKASKELAQTSYFMATNSLHLTTMCLRFPPTIVACVCIHLACKWSHYKIPVSAEGKRWFSYVDPEATFEQLEQLTDEFLTIFDRCPSRLKKKIKASSQATREEEDRRARGDIAASSYQLDLSIRPASSSTTTGNHAQQQQQQPSQPPGMHSQQHPGHGKHGQKSGGGSSFSSSSSGKSGHHHHQHQQHAMGGHPQRPPNAGSGPPGSSASGQSRPDKMHMSGSSSQQRPPPQSSDAHKRQTMDPAQYEEYKRRKMAEQQQAQMAAAKGGVSSQPGISMPSSGGQGQRPHSGSSASRPHPGQQQQHPPSSQRPGSHAGSNMMKTHPSGQHHHHHHQQQHQQLSSSSSKPQPPSMMLPLAGDPTMPPGQTVLPSSQGSTGHRKSMPGGGGPHGPKLPSANMANEPSKRLSLPHNHQKSMARPAGPPMPSSMGHNTKPPQPNSHRPQAAFQSHPQSSGGPQKQPHPQQQQQPPLPPTSVASRPSAPPLPSSSAPPKRSIFDIDLAESPIRDPGLNTLLEPINSPANLSDVSDLELREHAADVSLEPGEILDTPDVNGSLAHLGFTFPSLPTKDKDPKASQMVAQRPKAEPKSSPVKQVRNPAEVKKSSPTKSLFSNSRDPDQMTKSLIKHEPTTSIFGLANMKKGSPSPQKAPKSDLKRPSQTSSLFSPNSDSGNSDGPALKIPKLEETPGYEKLRDGRQTIRVAKEDRSGLPVPPPKEMIVSIPWNQQGMGDGSATTSASTSSLFQEDKKSSSSPSGEREHKEKKKKKKEKKEKKDKKDKDRSERKHKKHKDKDRERSSKEQPSSATSSPMVSGSSGTGIKLKIKVGRESNWDNAPPPPGPAGETIAPLKINLMGDSGKKRPRLASDSDSQQGPATKMSRALGTNVMLEDSYFTDIKRSKH